MTDLEKRAVLALDIVAMPQVTWHPKRREALCLRLAVDPNYKLKNSDAADLWFLAWHYRRQIHDAEVVRHAETLMTGAMSMAFD